MRLIRTGIVSVLLVFSPQLRSEGFSLDMIQTDDLRLLYLDPFQTHLVQHSTRSFQNSMDFQKKIFNWTPYDQTTVLLSDFTDYGNGAAIVSPKNLVIIDIAPKNKILETNPSTERFFQLMNHELTHIATMDGWNEQDRKWRRFFGGKPRQTDKHPESILYNYLATPRLSSPRWYAEGSATYLETWMSGGIGRVQGGYDEMVFRAMVRDGAHFYSNLGLVSEGTEVDFQVGANAYLYGTRFMSYLSLQYSPEHLIEWLSRNEDSERYYSKQFAKVFGKPLEEAWQDWIAFERQWQAGNLESVRSQPLTPAVPLVEQPLGSISRSFYDAQTNSMVGGFRYPGVVAHVGIMSLDSGEIRHLNDVKGPMLYRVTSPAFDAQSRTLFYTTDNVEYRDLVRINVDSGDAEMLIEDTRVGDLVFNQADRAVWGLRHLNGLVSLVRIPEPYTEWNMIYSWPQGQIPFDMDISPDGTLLSASVGEISGDQYLRIYRVEDLVDGKAEAISQFDFTPAIPEGFVFSPDGKYLYGTSYYTGVSNVFRYEIANGDVEIVTNAETGFFKPIPLEDGSMIVMEYSGQGFQPIRINPEPLEAVGNIRFLGNEIAQQHPSVRQWSVVNTLGSQPFEETIRHEGKYRPPAELGLISAFPFVEGYKDSESIGYHFDIADPLQLHSLDLSLGYSWDDDLPSDEKFHARIDYKALNWTASYWHNDADFYDLFGPKKRSRKGDAFLLGYERSLIYDDPRELDLSVDLNYYTGLDTLPNNQNVSTFLFEDILSARIGLDYTNTRKSLGAVDHEKGFEWDLVLSADHANSDTVTKIRGGFDFGFALPLKHSSIWFYNSAGSADGNRINPLSRFYFGGYQNNYVDDGAVKRYREYYSFPGFEIDQLSGKTFYKSVLEWNLPPKRFREAGSPSLFLKHARPALFISGLVTDPGKSFERTLTNIGFQVDFEFTLVHRLPMVFSVGYAAGYESGDKIDDELMFSLKIL
ncbi:MAG: hypothetical protein HKN15_11895 [Xanthomonadales bacterium]|nr:hypothetical protein [Xanthomonadales bacterium]